MVGRERKSSWKSLKEKVMKDSIKDGIHHVVKSLVKEGDWYLAEEEASEIVSPEEWDEIRMYKNQIDEAVELILNLTGFISEGVADRLIARLIRKGK